MGTGRYQLDKEHFPLYPDFEDNEVVMNEDDPQSVQAQEKKEKARKEKAAKMPTQEEASEYFLKTKQEQLGYLIASMLRIEQSLATLTQNQRSLERIMEQKFYDLDVKVTEIQSAVEQLQDDMQERKGKPNPKLVEEEKLSERAEELGQLFRSEIEKLIQKTDLITKVRGKGLLNAILINDTPDSKTAWNLCLQLKENGLLAKPTHGNIIRLAPPLVISEEQLLDCVRIIEKTVLEF